ncbi:MAG TPA: hypothetical protein VFF30_03385 [Nitrososphaerales archaeon]|nr:hypothetical protein [Nitrososphaerales archaeon]
MVRAGQTKEIKDLEIGATTDELRMRIIYNNMYVLVCLNEFDAAKLSGEIIEWIKCRENQVGQSTVVLDGQSA